jgi:small redox-active disulfide protein 2
MEVRILGTGCPKCKRLEQVTREALAEMEIDASVSKVTELDEIMEYDIAATPGLVINQKVVSSGRLPSKAEVKTLISEALS